MIKATPEISEYPFAWLDDLVEFELNPERSPVADLRAAQLQEIEMRIRSESKKIFDDLKKATFCFYRLEYISTQVGLYEKAIELLLEQANSNLQKYQGNEHLGRLGFTILCELDLLRSQLRKRFSEHLNDTVGDRKKPRTSMISGSKIRCPLSVDQIGIFLKAADDVKLIVSRSLSLIFRSIVPFLSTSRKKDISWDSMRSSTYHTEECDKLAVIAMLEKMIDKIREYQ